MKSKHRRVATVAIAAIGMCAASPARDADKALARGDFGVAVGLYRASVVGKQSASRRERTRERLAIAEKGWLRDEIEVGRAAIAAGELEAAYAHLMRVRSTALPEHPDVAHEVAIALGEAALPLVPPRPAPTDIAAIWRRSQEATRLLWPVAPDTEAYAVYAEAREAERLFWEGEIAAAGRDPGARYFAACALRDLGQAVTGAHPRDALAAPPPAPPERRASWLLDVSGAPCSHIQRELGNRAQRTGRADAELTVHIASCDAIVREETRVEDHAYVVELGSARWVTITDRSCRDVVRSSNDSGVASGTGIAITTRTEGAVCEDVSRQVFVDDRRTEERVDRAFTHYRDYRLSVRAEARATWGDEVVTFDIVGDLGETRVAWEGEGSSQEFGPEPWGDLARKIVDGTDLPQALKRADAWLATLSVPAAAPVDPLAHLETGTVRERDAAYAHLAVRDDPAAAVPWFVERYGLSADDTERILGCQKGRPAPPTYVPDDMVPPAP